MPGTGTGHVCAARDMCALRVKGHTVSESQPRTAAGLVADAKSRVENLSPDQVAAELASGDAELIGIRDSDEREQNGAIAGSVRASRGMLEF